MRRHELPEVIRRLALAAALLLAACGGDTAAAPAPLSVVPPPPHTVVVSGSNVCAIDGDVVRCVAALPFDVGPSSHGAREIAALAGSRSLALTYDSICGLDAAGTLTCLPSRPVDRPIRHVAPIEGGVVVADARGGVWRLARGDSALVGTPHLRDAVMVGAPYQRVCALSSAGRVACLPDHDLTVPAIAIGVDDVVQISSGWPFCLIRRDGRVLCERHVLDEEPTFDDFEVMPGLEHVVQVVSSGGEVCARLEGGAVHCFSAPASLEAGWDPGPAILDDAVELAAGLLDLRCARRRSGDLVCWGRDNAGLFHDSSPVERVHVEDPVDVALGDTHGCAATGAGAVVCWGGVGAPSLDLVAVSFPVASPTPVSVDVGIAGVVDVELWEGHVCGRSADGQIGCATPDGAGAPTWLPEAARVVELTQQCARTDDGDVYCDRGHAPDSLVPILVRTDSIARFGDELCGLRGGAVGCAPASWPSPYDPFGRRFRVPLARAVRLARGRADAVCAGDELGGWRCYGHNGVGQLGTAPSRPIGTPITFPGGPWDELVVGHHRTCAWRGDEPLSCAGVDAVGLPRATFDRGDGSLVPLPEIHHVRALALSPFGALAALDDGRLLSWGEYDPHGALGGWGSAWVPTPRVLDLDAEE